MNELFNVLVVVGAVVVSLVFVVWLWHVLHVRAGRKELRVYQDQVQTLTDTIDSLKQRHNLLRHMDQDFAVPMCGETLASYNSVAERLEHHREVAFKLTEVGEQALALLSSEHFLGSSRARSARQQLLAADAPTALAAVVSECEQPLARIEQAHTQAAAELQSYRQDNERLGAQLDAVAAAVLSVSPYEPERAAAAALVERGQGLLPGDPLGTLRCVDEARGKLAELSRRASRILEQATALKELANRFGAVLQAARQRRTEGFLLQEEGANPEVLLADVPQQQAAIQEALNEADDAAAGPLLSTAAALLERAHQGLEQHVEAKARCTSEIPIRQVEVRRLADVQALARAQHAELSRDFDAETWLGVAENVLRAQASLLAAERCTADAARQAAPDVQRFVQAGRLLDQAAANHQRADAELKAVGQRLRELVELRATCHAQLGQLRNRIDRVNQQLQSSSTDRALANERFRAARQALDRLIDDSRQPRPDWTRLTARVREIDSDLDRVEQLAKEDRQLAQQAAEEIAEAEKFLREARAFHDQGITADVSAANSQLAQAQGCLTAQGYEEAIRLANAAEQAARTALGEATSQVRRRQQELEAQRRAEQAAASPSPQTSVLAEPLEWTPTVEPPR